MQVFTLGAEVLIGMNGTGMTNGLPVVATSVGGIPEIFGEAHNELVAPHDAAGLAKSLLEALMGNAAARTENLRNRIREKFTVTAMTDGVLAAYAEALARKPA